MNSTPKVQAYRRRQKEKGRNQRTLYATDAEFKGIKVFLQLYRNSSTDDPIVVITRDDLKKPWS